MKANRIAVISIFFIYGLCFASWASRIPSIQHKLQLTESTLGAILFALPAGLFISLPIAGFLISHIGSRNVVILSAVLYTCTLVAIGFAASALSLIISLFAFGFFGSLLNISINTQAIGVEALYQKNIMATFHGMWSLGGCAGAAIGTWMTGRSISPLINFFFIFIFCLTVLAIGILYLLKKDPNSDAKGPLLSMPDKSLLGLGMIAFCSMIVEGAMFDWSGIYLKKVVMVEDEFIGAGYTAFMIAMASTRLVADWLSDHLGLKRMLQASGLLAAAGLLMAVQFPYILSSSLGFFLVGIGVSSVVPLIYSAVGKSKTLSPGVALSAVSSMGFVGLLIGPPIIGLIAGASSLRISFLTLAGMAFAVFALAFFKAIK